VRVCSILRKANLSEEKLQELIQKGFKITHPHEVQLAAAVLKLAENLDFCLDDLMLHRYFLVI
jgi:arginyl-tRNA synthetase